MTRRMWFGALILVASFLSAVPASAARWVKFNPSDPWLWVDLDAVYTQANLTYYHVEHSSERGIPPTMTPSLQALEANDPHLNSAFDCAQRRHFLWVMTNHDAWAKDESRSVEPIYVWEEDTNIWSADPLHEALVTICGSDNPPPSKPPPSEAEQQWLSLAEAVTKGDVKTVKATLARGVNPDTPHPNSEDRFSPLATAVCKGRIDLARLLISHHADINNIENVGNYTPLMFAAECGQPATIAFLLHAKARINEKANQTGNGWTALDFALSGHDAAHRKAAQILLAHGAVSGR